MLDLCDALAGLFAEPNGWWFGVVVVVLAVTEGGAMRNTQTHAIGTRRRAGHDSERQYEKREERKGERETETDRMASAHTTFNRSCRVASGELAVGRGSAGRTPARQHEGWMQQSGGVLRQACSSAPCNGDCYVSEAGLGRIQRSRTTPLLVACPACQTRQGCEGQQTADIRHRPGSASGDALAAALRMYGVQ